MEWGIIRRCRGSISIGWMAHFHLETGLGESLSLSEKLEEKIMKKITMLASLMLMSVCIVSQNVPVGLALIEDDPAYVVDVLLVCDDAFKSWLYHMGALRWVPAKTVVDEGAMPAVSELFEEAFGVTFYWDFAWRDWDSSDVPKDASGYTHADEMLEDAISDMNFDWGMCIDGRYIDIMMAWTGRLMSPIGYAPAPLNACVIKAPLNWMVMDNLAQHELSHLFNREGHCQNDCVMNGDPSVALIHNAWCGTCFEIINSNRLKFYIRPGDVDWDGDVDLDDLYYVTISYLMAIEDAMAKYGVPIGTDIDGDGIVDLDDLYVVMMYYGE